MIDASPSVKAIKSTDSSLNAINQTFIKVDTNNSKKGNNSYAINFIKWYKNKSKNCELNTEKVLKSFS